MGNENTSQTGQMDKTINYQNSLCGFPGCFIIIVATVAILRRPAMLFVHENEPLKDPLHSSWKKELTACSHDYARILFTKTS